MGDSHIFSFYRGCIKAAYSAQQSLYLSSQTHHRALDTKDAPLLIFFFQKLLVFPFLYTTTMYAHYIAFSYIFISFSKLNPHI